MSYQFIHVEAYSRTAGAGKAGGRNVGNVLAEADRKPGNCPHIAPEKLADPALAPARIYGLKLEKVEAEATKWAEQAKDAQGRALRKDGHCLLAGVVSLPNDTPPSDWQRFKADAVKWLKSEYGERLRSVIEHKDESHPHLHFYAVPEHGKGFASLHPGQQAARAAKAQGLKKGEQNEAYKNAMRDWQDKFSHDVGQKHGLTRIGPGQRRLTREEWKQEQKQAKSLQQAKSRAKSVLKQAEKQAEEITQQAQEKAQKTAGFGASVGGFVAGVAGKYHKPTKQAEEAAEKAAEALETERAKHTKAYDEQRKHYEHELAESESARDHLKLTIKEKNAALKTINEKYGDYIKEQIAQEKAALAAKEAEQRRQQREQEKLRDEERRKQRENDRGMDFDM